MINAITLRKEIKSIFKKLESRYDLRGRFRLRLEETKYLYNDIETAIPSKVELVGFNKALETIDLSKESSIRTDLIELQLTNAIERIDFYELIYNFSKDQDYRIDFCNHIVYLSTKDRKEIKISCLSKDRYCIEGRYLLAENSTGLAYRIEDQHYDLSFILCEATPWDASIKSAIKLDDIYADGLEELIGAIEETRHSLDYIGERSLKMELS